VVDDQHLTEGDSRLRGTRELLRNTVVCAGLQPGAAAVSVLAGGTVPGWSPEVAVVLWQRILGCLGNVNKIVNAAIHEQVYEFLCDLVTTLIKVTIAACYFALAVSAAKIY